MSRSLALRVFSTLVLVSSLGAVGCDDDLWVDRAPTAERSLSLRGVTVRLRVPEDVVVESNDEGVASLGPSPDVSLSDRARMHPMITITVSPTHEMPSGADEIVGADDAQVTALEGGGLRMVANLEQTVSITHYVPIGGGEGHLQCHVVMYGGRSRRDVEPERVERWADDICATLSID